MFYIEPLHIHLTSSTSKGFADHYGFMEQIKKLKIERSRETWMKFAANPKCQVD